MPDVVKFMVHDGVVIARHHDTLHRMGSVAFQRNVWIFTRFLPNGMCDGDYYIEVDIAEESKLMEMEQESRTNAANDTVLAGHLAAIKVKAEMFKAETQDLAELGAILAARRWWREGFTNHL